MARLSRVLAVQATPGTLRFILPALILALPLAACTSREVPITAEPARPSVTDTPPRVEAPNTQGQGVTLPSASNGVLAPGAADRVLAMGSPPLVKVLEAGAEPRSDLSYALAKGTAQKMGIAMDTSVSIKASGRSVPQTPIPRITMTFDTIAADKNALGDFLIDMRLIGTSIEPNGAQQEQMANALRPQLDAMKGLGIASWVSPKGRVRDMKLDVPASAPSGGSQLLSGMKQAFDAMVTPLPPDPVGVGGRWQVVSRVDSGGLDLLQSAIYTLKSRTGSKATVSCTIVQLAANDAIRTPGMPPAMSIKVKSFTASGSGATQLDLKSAVAETSSLSMKRGMDISASAPGSPSEDSSVETISGVAIARP